MKYPRPQAYNEALQMAQVSILDTVLRGGRVETDSLGLPFGRTGSFAITFKISAGGNNYAFRCFLQNRPTIHERYDAISSHLKGIQLPYFVDFTYLDEGIRVDNAVLPTVRMSWAGGIPLGLYIQDHHTDTGRMTALQQQVQGMALALGAAGLAHGDIQGGNLLIGDGGAIKLVDYDGMYVPSIAKLGAIETGHPNFQHPERASSKPFDDKVDQFSFALLHTVIAALIERPTLWSQLKSDPDKILLGESDIAAPFASPAFAALTQLPATGSFARSLQAIASASYAQVPNFTDFLNHRNIPTARASTRTKQAGPSSTASGSAPWYADHIPGGVNGQSGAHSPLGSYNGQHPVIDASDPWQWRQSPASLVEVIGQIAHVEVGNSGRNLPYTRLFLHRGNPDLTIDVWAEGLQRFAQDGVTVDASWKGQWISARGVVFGPVGSSSGDCYAITMVEPDRLERINVQQARWRLASAESKSKAQPNTKSAPNADALSSLSTPGSKTTAPPSGGTQAASQTPGPTPNSRVSVPAPASRPTLPSGVKVALGVLGGMVLLVIGIALTTSGLFTASGSGSGPVVPAAAPSAGVDEPDSADLPVTDTGVFALYDDTDNGKPIRWDRCRGPIYVSVDYGNLTRADQEFVYVSMLDALEAISAASNTSYLFAGEVTNSGNLEQARNPGRRSDDAMLISFSSPPEGNDEWRTSVQGSGSAATSWYRFGDEAWDWNYINEAAIQVDPSSVEETLTARLMAELAFASGLKFLDIFTPGELMGFDWSSPDYGPGDSEGLALLGDKPCN